MIIVRRKSKNGFTLVELLVTISIFAILTGVVLFSQSKFNSTILLTNLAYDTALTVRQAQTYGINIKNFTVANESNFSPYGVHFNINSPTSFVLFSDPNYDLDAETPSLTTYNPVELSTCELSENCVSRYSIKRGNKISDLCIKVGETWNCGLEKIDFMFKRPNPDAVIIASDGSTTFDEGIASAYVELSDADDENTRYVFVQPNGLIYISHENEN